MFQYFKVRRFERKSKKVTERLHFESRNQSMQTDVSVYERSKEEKDNDGVNMYEEDTFELSFALSIAKRNYLEYSRLCLFTNKGERVIMKRSKNEVEFVEFKACDRSGCGLFCVSCKKWFCSQHMKDCVQCQQVVCKECYLNDLCCLVRPWGETTEEHLKKFYENKLVVGKGMDVVAGYIVRNAGEEVRRQNLSKIRKDVFARSVLYFVDNFDESFAFSVQLHSQEQISKLFPRISRYIENEETRLKFVDFMKKVAESRKWLFAYILAYFEDRDDLITMTEELIRNDEVCLIDLIETSLREHFKSCFDCLKYRGLLDWSKVEQKDSLFVEHIDGMNQTIDVLNNEEHSKRFALWASKEVKEYLASKGGKMIEYLISDDFIRFDNLEI